MEHGPVAVAVAAVLGWAIMLPYLGFAVTTAAALFVLGRAIGPGPIGRLLAFAVLASAGASMLFRQLLTLPLPRGPWGW
jgi:putative tricarboxylic transport membrane protein